MPSSTAIRTRVALSILGGILVFFVLEKLFLWRHSHDDHDVDGHGGGTRRTPRPRQTTAAPAR